MAAVVDHGTGDEAEAAFRKALEVDPHNQAALERLRSVLEDKLERRLVELGYLSKVNKPVLDFTAYENRAPIAVSGKPLSETSPRSAADRWPFIFSIRAPW